MNAKITPSHIEKILMWNKVRNLKSLGLNKSQISRKLRIDRGTVRKYLRMSESEFLESECYKRHYEYKLKSYEDYVLDDLRDFPFLSSSQIHDHLKERFPSLPKVSTKTVYNFVQRIRNKYNLPKESEKSYRPSEKLPEVPYGEYAQVDFGERYMTYVEGGHVKIYFFAMVLSRSRQKFIYMSTKPFTTASAIYAHELAFEYYGGVPKKIIYDQDKVFISKENLGDYLLTNGFRRFVNDIGFEVIFCRKGDPESKGKIENVVKYVKYNFLRGRKYTNIDTLNQQVISWLERTGNGTVHATTRLIPSEEYLIEREYLKPYEGIPTPPKEEIKGYYVRKDNTVNYHGNFYTVPVGTYNGRNTIVYLMQKDYKLHIFNKDTGKTIALHDISQEKGKLIKDSSHHRSRGTSFEELENRIKSKLNNIPEASSYIEKIKADKPRYYRDNLDYIDQRCLQYTMDTLSEAVNICSHQDMYNGIMLMDVAETIRKRKREPLMEVTDISVYNNLNLDSRFMPDKTDINQYNALFR